MLKFLVLVSKIAYHKKVRYVGTNQNSDWSLFQTYFYVESFLCREVFYSGRFFVLFCFVFVFVFVLFCFVLFCFVLFCFVLFCFVLFFLFVLFVCLFFFFCLLFFVFVCVWGVCVGVFFFFPKGFYAEIETAYRNGLSD